MISVVRRTEKAYYGHDDAELKKAPAFTYWQRCVNALK
jgi:hypothetical protein